MYAHDPFGAYGKPNNMKNPVNPTYFISLYLDTRRDAVKGLYPVKLRVFTKAPRKQKLYSTKFKLSEKEFQSTWQTLKPRQEHKDLRSELQAVIDKAEEVAKGLKPFAFEGFEKKLLSKSDDQQNIFYQYDKALERLRENKQFGTADTYELCCKALKAYLKHKTGQDAKRLLFEEVTTVWLAKFEAYMTEVRGLSLTTVSMYVRTLRTLFNAAIDAKDIERESYPFGRRKYQVPAPRNVKKALDKGSLRKLFDAIPLNFEEERAKDLFFFSYVCNGMNLKDVANLKYKCLRGDFLVFVREKTKRTAKANHKPVYVPLTEYSKGIIEKYGNKDQNPDNFIFPILSKLAGDYQNFRRVKNLITSVNHNIKKLALAAGIKEDISTYSARHSFATNAIRGGASMEYISEALSHSNLKTTQNYFAGFEDKIKIEITNSLLEF